MHFWSLSTYHCDLSGIFSVKFILWVRSWSKNKKFWARSYETQIFWKWRTKKWVSQGAVDFWEKAWILLTKSKVSYVNFKVDSIFFWNILRKGLRDQNVPNYHRITFRKLKERSKMPLLFEFQTFVFSNFAHKSDEMVLVS